MFVFVPTHLRNAFPATPTQDTDALGGFRQLSQTTLAEYTNALALFGFQLAAEIRILTGELPFAAPTTTQTPAPKSLFTETVDCMFHAMISDKVAANY